MIPIRDHNPSGRFPFINITIMAVNVFLFGYMFLMNEYQLEEFIGRYALVPSLVTQGQNLFSVLSSMFLHGGLFHIVGNMLFLNIFGDNLEDRLGHIGYVLFYLFSGLGASALQILTNPESSIPNLGASGAIAGIMGGYLVLFPGHKVDVILPIGIFLTRATLPAFTMLFYWLVVQALGGIGSLGIETGGIAYFAHIGGFVTGALTVLLAGKK